MLKSKSKKLSSPDMIKIHKTMKSGKMSDWQVGEYNYIYLIYSLEVIQTYRIHPTNKKEKSLIFHSLSRAYTVINLGGGQTFFLPPPKSLGGGQNLNRKFKTFGLLEYFQGIHTLYSPITMTRTTLSLHQTKLTEKTIKLLFLILFALQFQI